MSPGNLGNINFIFSHNIVNKETQAIILRALDSQPLAPWPGTEFVAGEASEYWALLGMLRYIYVSARYRTALKSSF
jgi:hypothetical protein